MSRSPWDDELQFYEPPPISLGQRIKVGVMSFGTGFVGITLTTVIVGVTMQVESNENEGHLYFAVTALYFFVLSMSFVSGEKMEMHTDMFTHCNCNRDSH